MDEDLPGGCAVTFVVAALLVGVFFGVMGISWHADHVDCLRLHEQTTYETHMKGTMFGGECYINIDGRWIPASRYRAVDIDN